MVDFIPINVLATNRKMGFLNRVMRLWRAVK